MKMIRYISVKSLFRIRSTRSIGMFLERIKAREIISEAFLQVVRVKPDDPIEFLSN